MTAPLMAGSIGSFLAHLCSRCANLEVFVCAFALLFAYLYVVRSGLLYDFIGKTFVRLEVRILRAYDHMFIDHTKIHRTLDKARTSWELRKGNVVAYAIQGQRPNMEDRFSIVTELEHTNASIYGVFDGHGGEFAAEYVEKTLLKMITVRLLKAKLASEQLDLSSMLKDEILRVDKMLVQVAEATAELSGTTALVALLQDNKLYVANVGDSRAVMCDQHSKAVPLSFDHKPHQINERRRIKNAGGFISFNGVWRVAGILATSRALGDYPLKARSFVIADPDILVFDLDELSPRFIILATDGLWDAFSNEEAVSYISERLDEPHLGAKSIVLQAYYRGTLDNVTVIVIDLRSGRAVAANTHHMKNSACGISRESDDFCQSAFREDNVHKQLSNGKVCNGAFFPSTGNSVSASLTTS